MNAYLVVVAIPDPADQMLVPGAVNVPSVGHSWTLQPSLNIVGREPTPGVHVVLPWLPVSRRHAEIELFANNLWEIVDHSRNGTWVNGQRLTQGALTPLNDGDCLQIGYIQLVFCFQLDPVASPPASEEEIESP